MARSTIATPAGSLTAAVDPGRVWRVARRPNPWAWVPWEYAGDNGRFDGRFDDPAGGFRTTYAGAELLACLLEALAPFRPDPLLADDLASIEEGPDDAANYPTQATGTVPSSWLDQRVAATAVLDVLHAALSELVRTSGDFRIALFEPRYGPSPTRRVPGNCRLEWEGTRAWQEGRTRRKRPRP